MHSQRQIQPQIQFSSQNRSTIIGSQDHLHNSEQYHVFGFLCLGIYMYIRMYIHTQLEYEFIFTQGRSLLLVSLWILSIPKITIRNQERRERKTTFNFHLKIFIWKSCCLLIGLLFATKFARKKRNDNVSCSLPSANASIIGGNTYINGHWGLLIQSMAKSTKPPTALQKNSYNQHGPPGGFQLRYAVFHTTPSSCIWYLR